MKISSPIGDYDYRMEGVKLREGRIEVVGRLGEWQTTTILERSDLVTLLRKAVFPLLLVGGGLAVTRWLRRV